MQVTKDIEAFGRACEHLMASVRIHRPLTEAEVLFVRRYCKELHETKGVSDATFKAVADKFGERGVIDLLGVTGYYTMLAMVLNVAQQPLPGGVAPPLSVIK